VGEDFLRKKNENFRRLRDAYWEREQAPTLFDTCSPELNVSLNGTLTPDTAVSEGDLLWAGEADDRGRVPFYYQDRLAACIEGREAMLLQDQPTPWTATVGSQDTDLGFVELRLHAASDSRKDPGRGSE